MMATSPNKTEVPILKPDTYLTRECECVQGELMELAAALDTAALPEYATLVPTFLNAVREFRKYLREHASAIEGPAGLYDYLAYDAPALSSELVTLSEEHCRMDECLEKLERQLAHFDPNDVVAAEAIRISARQLGQLTCCHHQHGCKLVRLAAGK